MQQTVDATQIHERAVVGDVLDDTVDDRTFLERFHQLLTLFAQRGFNHGTARQHNVVALAVQLDDLEFEGLAFVRRGVLDRTHVDERTRQECTNTVDHDGQAALDLAGHGTGDDLAGFQCLLKVQPRSQTLGLVARQDGVAVAVFQRVDCDRNVVADLHFQLALIVQELFDRNKSFRLQARVHNDEVVVNTHNFRRDHFASLHIGLGDRLFEQGGKRFVSLGHKK